jgi:hypothetical protein
MKKPCPDCDGNNELLSDCCGASDESNGDGCLSDYGICPECREHCEFIACETCGGSGEIEIDSHLFTPDEVADWFIENHKD